MGGGEGSLHGMSQSEISYYISDYQLINMFVLFETNIPHGRYHVIICYTMANKNMFCDQII